MAGNCRRDGNHRQMQSCKPSKWRIHGGRVRSITHPLQPFGPHRIHDILRKGPPNGNIGPYEIVKKLNDVNYLLQRGCGKSQFVTHADMLKRCCKSDVSVYVLQLGVMGKFNCPACLTTKGNTLVRCTRPGGWGQHDLYVLCRRNNFRTWNMR